MDRVNKYFEKKMQYKILLTALIFVIAGCEKSQQPQKLTNKIETIEVSYTNWACDCANFIETKHIGLEDEIVFEKLHIFIEPANQSEKIPDSYYIDEYHDKYLQLTGQFYEDEGIPDSYEQKTPLKPDKRKVFRYNNYKYVDKK